MLNFNVFEYNILKYGKKLLFIKKQVNKYMLTHF